MPLEVKVIKLGNSYVVTIPKQIAKALEIREGVKMKLHLRGDSLVYEKVKV